MTAVKLGNDAPSLVAAHSNLGAVLRRSGRPEEVRVWGFSADAEGIIGYKSVLWLLQISAVRGTGNRGRPLAAAPIQHGTFDVSLFCCTDERFCCSR